MNNIIAIEEKLLLKLPAAEMAQRLMNVSASKRLELLLSRSDAASVVAFIAPQDFYFFLTELGAESSGPLLSLCQPEQFSHLLDVEGWRGDELAPGKMLTWCARLLATSEHKFLVWLYEADFELLVLLFKNWLGEVVVAGEEDYQEQSDNLPLSTIDNQYYFTVRYPDFGEVIRFILSFLFENHQQFYQALMHDVRFALNAEVEELAYRFHRGRLEDNAIPDIFEAGTIYRGIKRHALGSDKNLRLVVEEDQRKPPTFALAKVPEEGIFSAGLSHITDGEAQDILQHELVSLANKVLVADHLEVSESDTLGRAVDKAIAYVNLGLEEICGPDSRQAAEALCRHHLEDLFRLGFTHLDQVLAPLLATVQKGWIGQWPEGINILEPNWQEEVSLLTLKTPMLLRKGRMRAVGEDYIRYRGDLQRIADLHAMLQAMEPVYAAIERDRKEGWQLFAAGLWEKGQSNCLAEVTLARLLFTAAARALWQGEWRYDPLPVASWKEIYSVADPVGLREKISQQGAVILPDRSSRSLLDRYLNPVFVQYEGEMKAHPPASAPDPRLVPFFLFRKEA